MIANVSITRLYVLRAMYLLNCLLVGSGVCAQFLQRSQPWDPIRGVAFSFLGALAILSAVGLRYPLAMLPVIFMQLCYKALWLAAVYLPLRAVGRSTDLVQIMLIGALLDVIAIPWGYVLAQYVRAPGDQWRRGSVRPAA